MENESEGTRLGRTHPDLEIDYSEVKGKTYSCIDNCALCCLCQPELLPLEAARFRNDPILAQGVADRHISPEVRGAAIKLRGAYGACHFLENKRCKIYTMRPHFCRLFPVNVFVGWRIQLMLNLSCRGIGLPGEDLEEAAKKIVADYGDEELSSQLGQAKRVFTEFVRNCRETGVAQSFSSLRNAADLLMDELGDEVGLSRVLTYAEHGRTRQNASPADIAKLARKSEAVADLQERALMDGTELFDLPDLSLLPIYIDEKLAWRLFELKGDRIIGYLLGEDGSTKEFARIDPNDVELKPMDARGRAQLTDYVKTINSRDCFLGHAAYLCDTDDYEFNFAQVYLGAVANNALDLWWRSSFLAKLDGRERLGAREIRNGIVFFDMDLLDLPTIGAFI